VSGGGGGGAVKITFVVGRAAKVFVFVRCIGKAMALAGGLGARPITLSDLFLGSLF
jgi:hypothetical protein